jgi:hypothetical protein
VTPPDDNSIRMWCQQFRESGSVCVCVWGGGGGCTGRPRESNEEVALSSLMKQNFTSMDMSTGTTVSYGAVSPPQNFCNMNGVVLK